MTVGKCEGGTHDVIACKYSCTLALPLTYSSMLLLMLLSIFSICSSDIGGTLGAVLYTGGGATLELTTGAVGGGAFCFDMPVMLDELPIGGNIGGATLRCEDAADEDSFADRCCDPDLEPRPSYLLL